MNRLEQIRMRLGERFQPSSLEVIDESHLHAGHAGARDGRGHYRVRIVAQAFAGQSAVKCHRMIYDALGELMTNDIHALSIEASPPGEAKQPRGPS
jgi:BolA family transcriptional regulator, general stress-responsive regulator